MSKEEKKSKTEFFDVGLGSSISDVLKDFMDSSDSKVVRLSETLSIDECDLFGMLYHIGVKHKEFEHLADFTVSRMLFRMALERKHVDKVIDALKMASGYQFLEGQLGLGGGVVLVRVVGVG